MLFNSIQFLLFFPVVILFFFLLRKKVRVYFLLGASLFFYGIWEPKYLLLILFSTTFSFLVARKISGVTDERRKKRLMILNVCVAIGILFFFKYFNFFNDTLGNVFGHFHLAYHVPDLAGLIFPIGISFYTFETVSYVLDVYLGVREAEKDFSVYALYIAFFPKLLAGPIEQSTHLLPQLKNETAFNQDRIISGLNRMLWGFFKKIVIADRLSLITDPVFSSPATHHPLVVLIGCYAAAIQVYCDFSGYTDIAIGASKILGYDIVENFDRPFSSKSVGEFWRRWHMSLSFWLRDYLFNPIVYSRRTWGKYALILATFITFFLCGLWHGPRWSFVVFGLLQGTAICIELLLQKQRKKWTQKFPGFFYGSLSMLVTFHFTVFSFIFFRAKSLTAALQVVKSLFHKPAITENIRNEFSTIGILTLAISFFMILYMFVIEKRFLPTFTKLQRFRPLLVFGAITLCFLVVFGYFDPQTFIYFQY